MVQILQWSLQRRWIWSGQHTMVEILREISVEVFSSAWTSCRSSYLLLCHPSSIVWRSCLILFLVAMARSYPPATKILSRTFLHLLVLWGSQRLLLFMLWRFIFNTSWREMEMGLVLESSQSRLQKVSTMIGRSLSGTEDTKFQKPIQTTKTTARPR